MTKKDHQPAPLTSAPVGASLYDLFDNLNGPSYNELWASFVNLHPVAAGKLLKLANEYGIQLGNPSIAEAILLGSVKVAAYCDPNSIYNPLNYNSSIVQIEKLFSQDISVSSDLRKTL